MRMLAALLALVAAAGPVRADPGAPPGAPSGVEGWLLKFAGGPSRYLGTPGHRAALNAVEAAFTSLGLKRVRREHFTVTAPVEEGVFVTAPGIGRTVLHAVWPNHVQCSVTPRAGLTGALLDGGHGEAEALDGRDAAGAIVLVRLPCAGGPQGWTTPFILGAAAVILLPPADPGALPRPDAEELFLDVPADLPRFWAEPAAAAALLAAARRAPQATLVSRVSWREIPTDNIIGELPGARLRFPSEDTSSTASWDSKLVILQAYTDSMSVVPALAPGAEDAGGLIALLELAKHFAAHPVPPTLVFLATSGHHHVLAGSHDYLARHIRRRLAFSKSITGGEAVAATYWIGLDLSSGDGRVAAFSQGTFYNGWDADLLAQNAWAGAARLLDDHAKRLWGAGASDRYLNGVSPPTRAWKDLLGYRAAFDAEAATFTGTPGLTFATPFDARLKSDTPADTPNRVNVGALTRQIETIRDLLSAALADAHFFSEMKLELPDLARALNGEVHEFERTITGLPNKPIPHALLTVRSGMNGSVVAPPKTYGSVRGLHAWFSETDNPLTLTETETGRFRASILRKKEYWQWVGLKLEGFVFDADGKILLAPDSGPLSAGQFASDINFGLEDEKSVLLQLFRCRPLTILEPVDARNLRFLDKIQLQDEFDQPFMNEGYSIVEGQSTATEGYTPAVVVFVPRERAKPGARPPRVKVLLSTGPFGLQSVLTGADEGLLDVARNGFSLDAAKGSGYAVDRPVLTRAPFEGARDLWALDDARGRTLISYHVRNARIEHLHDQAHAALLEARAAWAGKKYGDFLEASRRAWGLEARAYPEFKSVANDLVKTVVFYCLLLIPFSFCLERLFFAYPDLKHQLMATAGFFIAGFAALSRVHPAFKISSNPMIIFLAFIVLSLGLIVLAIIISKFQRELRRLKGERGDYESVDIGRISATVAALILGLSNLRKRPLRTALTITTVVVLTFTVLSLVSLSSTIGFFRLPRGGHPPYAGALVRDTEWQVLQPPVESFLRTAMGPDAFVLPRAWVTARKRDEGLLLDIAADGGRRASVPGMLGLSPEEADMLHPAVTLNMEGRWLKPGERDACLLPADLAGRLGVRPGGSVTVRGVRLTVVGLFSGPQLDAFRDLDGEPLTPAKFAVHRGRYDYETATEPPPTTAVSERFTSSDHLPGNDTPIVSFDAAVGLEGRLRSLAVVARPGRDMKALAERIKAFLVRAAVIALVSDGQKIQLVSSVGAVSISGSLDLLLPLVLVGLIVLNTMMGSVHERTREISIFSSVGLAPVHIGALFVAEAFVVAVVGVVMGYLLAQTIAAVLLSSGSLAGLSLNYSSTAAVGACLIVMAAVMLSTIYPARRAAALSVPDVTRRWSLPPAVGDLLAFDFPFTVGENDLIGLFTYLTDLFRAYRDSSIGSFATDHVGMTETDGGIAIVMICWLAPYDLGISQSVKLEAIPMPVKGLYRVHVKIQRNSGEAGAWHRQNRRFLTTLRKRFLIWRMFGGEQKARYTAEGRHKLGMAAPEREGEVAGG